MLRRGGLLPEVVEARPVNHDWPADDVHHLHAVEAPRRIELRRAIAVAAALDLNIRPAEPEAAPCDVGQDGVVPVTNRDVAADGDVVERDPRRSARRARAVVAE